MQRKMIKWKPFNTLLKYKDILDIERNRSLIDKPVIMEDRIIKIDNILKDVNEKIEEEGNTLKSFGGLEKKVKSCLENRLGTKNEECMDGFKVLLGKIK